MGDIPGTNEEPKTPDILTGNFDKKTNDSEIKCTSEEKSVDNTEKKSIPQLQHVVVTLAGGRRGVFVGPALISKAELLLKPPQLVDIVFSEPRDYPTPVKEEIQSADTKVAEQPTSDAGSTVEKKA